MKPQRWVQDVTLGAAAAILEARGCPRLGAAVRAALEAPSEVETAWAAIHAARERMAAFTQGAQWGLAEVAMLEAQGLLSEPIKGVDDAAGA